MKISTDLKTKLQEQAKRERIPMVSLVCDMLELGLLVRPKMKQDNIEKLLSVAEIMHLKNHEPD